MKIDVFAFTQCLLYGFVSNCVNINYLSGRFMDLRRTHVPWTIFDSFLIHCNGITLAK